MPEVTRRCIYRAAPAEYTATGTEAHWRPAGRLPHFLVAAFFSILLSLSHGCVTETKSQSEFTPSALGVSVELRRTITGIGYEGVLFTPLDAEGAKLLGWSPSEFDIARMEARLPQILLEAGPRVFAGRLPDLGEYRRQYSGHLADDRRIIQVNYIHFDLVEERGLDWKHRRVPVYGAGARFFQVWFDVEDARIIRLLPES